jgi:hypothetical protein
LGGLMLQVCAARSRHTRRSSVALRSFSALDRSDL